MQHMMEEHDIEEAATRVAVSIYPGNLPIKAYRKAPDGVPILKQLHAISDEEWEEKNR